MLLDSAHFQYSKLIRVFEDMKEKKLNINKVYNKKI